MLSWQKSQGGQSRHIQPAICDQTGARLERAHCRFGARPIIAVDSTAIKTVTSKDCLRANNHMALQIWRGHFVRCAEKNLVHRTARCDLRWRVARRIIPGLRRHHLRRLNILLLIR